MSEEYTNIQVNMESMRKDISSLKESQDKTNKAFEKNDLYHADLKKSVDIGNKAILAKIDDLDSKFSGKWVETMFIWAARILGGAFLLGLAGFLIKVFVDYASAVN